MNIHEGLTFRNMNNGNSSNKDNLRPSNLDSNSKDNLRFSNLDNSNSRDNLSSNNLNSSNNKDSPMSGNPNSSNRKDNPMPGNLNNRNSRDNLRANNLNSPSLKKNLKERGGSGSAGIWETVIAELWGGQEVRTWASSKAKRLRILQLTSAVHSTSVASNFAFPLDAQGANQLYCY